MSKVTGGRQAQAAYAAAIAAVPVHVGRVVTMYGAILQRRVRANASGRPGPRAQTGDYRRSISEQTTVDRDGWHSTVGTNAPQGWRLEKGYTGTDAAGRLVDQAPLEHFAPAFTQTAPEMEQALKELVHDLTGGTPR